VLAAAAVKDVDVVLTGNVEDDTQVVVQRVVAIASGESVPSANAGGFVDFQLSRGLLGVST
jgi:hypothetical protein